MSLLDDLGMGNWLSGNAVQMPQGYSNLTPDQLQMQQNVGYFPRPDMVLPAGVQNTQPAGYQNLTPAQSMTTDALGYYTQGAGTNQQSLWDKITQKLGGLDAKSLPGGGFNTPQARPNLAPPAVPPHLGYGGYNPYRSIYKPPVLDPRAALQTLMRGY